MGAEILNLANGSRAVIDGRDDSGAQQMQSSDELPATHEVTACLAVELFPHGGVMLVGEVGGAAGASPSSFAKKLSSAAASPTT